MSDHEAAGVGETPPTAEDEGDQSVEVTDFTIQDPLEVEEVSDRQIRYYFENSKLSHEQTQLIGEARYKGERLTAEQIQSMKDEIRTRVSGDLVLGEPELPYNDPPSAMGALGGEEWDLDASVLTEGIGVPRLGTQTRELSIPMLELFDPADCNLHRVRLLDLKVQGKSVKGLSLYMTQLESIDGSTKHHSCLSGGDMTYFAPCSEAAITAMRPWLVNESDNKLKPKGLRMLSPQDTFELFKRAKSRKPGTEIPFRDVVVARIFTVYGPETADLANDVIAGELMTAYARALNDPGASQRDEVIAALRKADKKSNGSNPAPSDAGPVEDSTSKTPGRPGNTPKEEGEQMTRPETSGVTMTQQGNRPSVPVPPTIDLQGEPPQPRTGVTTAIREGVEPLGTQPGHDRENALSDDEFRQIGTIAGEDIEKLARKNFLYDVELQHLMARADVDDKLSSDERKELIAKVRARQPKPAWKKAFEDHKAKLPYAGMAILALIVAGLLISRPSNANGVVTDPAAATVPTEVRMPLELVGTPVRASQATDGTWMVRVPVRVPAELNHGEWRTMSCSVSGSTVPPTAGQQPGLLVNGATYVRSADGKEKVEVVLTREGELDLSKMQVVVNEVASR